MKYKYLWIRDEGPSEIAVGLGVIHYFSLIAPDGSVVDTYDFFAITGNVSIDICHGMTRLYPTYGDVLEYDGSRHKVTGRDDEIALEEEE